MDYAKGASRPLQVPTGQSPEDAVAALNWQRLAANLNPLSLPLGQNASVSATHDGEKFSLNYALSSAPANSPGLIWEPVPNGAGKEEAFYEWQNSAYDSAEDSLRLSSIDMTLAYSGGGLITTSGATVQMSVRITINVIINLHIAGQDALSTTANILDYIWKVPYQVSGEGPSFAATIVGETHTDWSQSLDEGILARLVLPSGAFTGLHDQGMEIGAEVAHNMAGPLLAALAG